MNTAVRTSHEIDVKDIEYLRHGSKTFLARLYKPRGKGPFPLIIDLHGGAWTKKDRMSDVGTDEPLAKSGVVVAALDFRMPPTDPGYPASMQDVNYAVRWFKANAAEFGSRADLVGILGVSSGGHLAMLNALRPADARYRALPLAGNTTVDASVRCVVLCWPVIDPLGRFSYAKENKAAGKLVQFADSWIEGHTHYWPDEAAMAEGNPTMALERGEKTPTPPVLYIQGAVDKAHPAPHRERFINAYRKAGGRVEPHLFEGMDQAFITDDPTSPSSLSAIDKIIEFVHREMR